MIQIELSHSVLHYNMWVVLWTPTYYYDCCSEPVLLDVIKCKYTPVLGKSCRVKLQDDKTHVEKTLTPLF